MSKNQLKQAVIVLPVNESPFQVTIPQEALILKKNLLEASSRILAVTSEEEQALAVEVVSNNKAYVKEIEKLGLEARRPHQAVQDAILAKQRELTDKVKEENVRIESGLISPYQAEQLRKAKLARQEEERRRKAALEEEQRQRDRLAAIERERVAAEARAVAEKKAAEKKAAEEAAAQRERDRIAAELKAKQAEEAERQRIAALEVQRRQAESDAAAAKDQAAKDAIAAEQARIEREAQEAAAAAQRARDEAMAEKTRLAQEEADAALARTQKEQQDLEEQNRLMKEEFAAEFAADAASENVTANCTAPVEQVATGAKGASVRTKNDIVITDIHALYAAHRQCVELTPRMNAINDLVRAGITEIPGVSIISRVAVSTRAAKGNLFQ